MGGVSLWYYSGKETSTGTSDRESLRVGAMAKYICLSTKSKRATEQVGAKQYKCKCKR